MKDQISGLENARPGKRRTKSQGWKMQDLENDGPNRWKMTDHYRDQIAILVLENAYFQYYENSFIGALSGKFTGQKNTNCLFQSNVKYHIPAWSSDLGTLRHTCILVYTHSY